jgi:hypothetical protein
VRIILILTLVLSTGTVATATSKGTNMGIWRIITDLEERLTAAEEAIAGETVQLIECGGAYWCGCPADSIGGGVDCTRIKAMQ